MKKMKKVLFLMFLLFLIGLGTVGVKAQVRIGGNTAPSAAAVLDLNAGNDNVANTGTGGLVLPRVDLTSSTKQLTPGVANQTGTMVYNVTTTLGRIGVYYWNGNSWVQASLPSTSAADSGKILMSNGVSWGPVQLLKRNTFGITTTSAWAPNSGYSPPQTIFQTASCFYATASVQGMGQITGGVMYLVNNTGSTIPAGTQLAAYCWGMPVN